MNTATQREEELFDEARQLSDPAVRREFLDLTCVGDPALRTRLEALLAAGSEAEKFFTEIGAALTLPPAPAAAVAGEEAVGTRIGRYKLLQKIGEGGWGVVYLAGQEEPVRRRVALKIIKLGMETKSVIARFEAERQALAMMDHPNIARVYDAGATDRGPPYFVMELVRGVKITTYCDQHRLGTRARLDLFIQVCHAIQHAHQKGIIHGDIKPSNIMVTLHDGIPVPKVIDFGISKATEARLTDRLLFTSYAQLIGTPAYMSPEQADMNGLDTDTRSDIYSLGVLLYELLTGTTPFDAKQLLESGLDEMRRTLREKEPARPSARLTTLQGAELARTASERQAEPHRLAALLVSQERFEEADKLLNEVSLTQPTVEGAAVLRSVAEWHALRLQWKQAAERMVLLLQVDPLDGADASSLDCLRGGPIFIELGDTNSYERFRQGAIARFSPAPCPFADRIVKISLLLPANDRLLESLKPLAEETARYLVEADQGGDVFTAAWRSASLSLLEYRRGNYAKAQEWSRRCLAYPGANAPRTAMAQMILALSAQRLGRPDEARAELAVAREIIENKFRHRLDAGNPVQGFWFDWLFSRILLREGVAQLEASPGAP